MHYILNDWHINAYWVQSESQKCNLKFSSAMIDIDHSKHVLDAGDKIQAQYSVTSDYLDKLYLQKDVCIMILILTLEQLVLNIFFYFILFFL